MKKQTQNNKISTLMQRCIIYVLLITGISSSISAQTTPTKTIPNLAAGDIAFIAYNSRQEGMDVIKHKGFAIVTLVTISVPSPDTIFFTDNEWDNDLSGDNSRWDATEGILAWRITSNIPAGTVVTFSNVTQGSGITASTGAISRSSGDFDPSTANESIWAYAGDEMDPNPLAVVGISNDNATNGQNRVFVTDQDNLIVSSVSGRDSIYNSGLTIGTHVFDSKVEGQGKNRDVLEYVGPRSGEMSFADYLSYLMDGTNWKSDDGSNAAIDAMDAEFPPDVTAFTIDKAPTLTNTTIATDNSYVDVTFSEGVYNAAGGSGALEASDFALSISGGTATLNMITSVTQTGGSALVGGEMIVRVNFTLTGTADGMETLEVDLIA
ncbi:MAG: hypothetical protein OXH57_01660, partial [Ekhidna sp.]|nr:hypothetical protein [Ekhidna sp.]